MADGHCRSLYAEAINFLGEQIVEGLASAARHVECSSGLDRFDQGIDQGRGLYRAPRRGDRERKVLSRSTVI